MGADFTEEFDSTLITIAKSRLIPIDTLYTESFTAVLLGKGDCSLNTGFRAKQSLKNLSPPAWLESLPKDNKFFYAVGVAPRYYYEMSSWLQAERYARRNLAGAVFVAIKSLQKMAAQGQEIRNEELSITLSNIQIVGRWRDANTDIFYILVRMPK